jgi:hypothetical protein
MGKVAAVAVVAATVKVPVELTVAVTPAGAPEAVKATDPEKPFSSVTETVLEALAPPSVIATLLGEAERLKSGCVAGVTVTVACAVAGVPVPVTVSV